jgi:hypothetical protein
MWRETLRDRRPQVAVVGPTRYFPGVDGNGAALPGRLSNRRLRHKCLCNRRLHPLPSAPPLGVAWLPSVVIAALLLAMLVRSIIAPRSLPNAHARPDRIDLDTFRLARGQCHLQLKSRTVPHATPPSPGFLPRGGQPQPLAAPTDGSWREWTDESVGYSGPGAIRTGHPSGSP